MGSGNPNGGCLGGGEVAIGKLHFAASDYWGTMRASESLGETRGMWGIAQKTNARYYASRLEQNGRG